MTMSILIKKGELPSERKGGERHFVVHQGTRTGMPFYVNSP